MGVGTPVRIRRGQIAAREEETEGTAISLTNAYADIKPENVTFTPDLPFYPRPATSASFSQFTGTSGGPRMGELSFEVSIAGSGTAGTAPSWGPLLKGCGFYESLVASTSVTYKPRTARPDTTVDQDSNSGTDILYVASTTGFYKGDLIHINKGGARAETAVVSAVNAGVSLTLTSNLSSTHTAVQADEVYPYPGSLTIAWYVDGLVYKLDGARGNFRLVLPTGEPGKIAFSFRGAYNAPTDTDLLTSITYESTVPPAIVNGSMTLDSEALKYKSLEIDVGNQLADRPCPSETHGGLSTIIASRETTGSMDPEMLAQGTYDFFDNLITNSTGALALTIGSATGETVDVTAPAVQFAAVEPGDRDGIQTAGLSLRFNRSANAGEDDLSIAIT